MPKKKVTKELRQKGFNSQGFNKAIRELYDNRLNAKAFKKSIEALGCSVGMNMEEVDLIVTTQTGFVNPVLSADAIGHKEDYLIVSRYMDALKVDNYEDDFSDVAESVKAKIKEQYTSYWTKEEQETLERVDVIINELNEMGHAVRKSFTVNAYGEIGFNEKAFNALSSGRY